MAKKYWAEDPNTKMECAKCGTTWKLGDNIGCPKCDGIDGGLNHPAGEEAEQILRCISRRFDAAASRARDG